MRGINSAGTPGDWSATGTVFIGATPTPLPVPGTASLTSPAAGAVVSQPFTFDWSDVAGAAWYVIEVNDSAGTLVWAATTTPSTLATNSLPNGALTWRVRAFNADGIGGAFSVVRAVTVGATAPPSAPVAAQPRQ